MSQRMPEGGRAGQVQLLRVPVSDDPREDGILREILEAAPCLAVQVHKVLEV